MSKRGTRISKTHIDLRSIRVLTAMLFISANANAAEGAVKHFVARARETHSASMLLLRDEKVAAQYRDAGATTSQIELRSASKSVVALGIGSLLHDGLLESPDTPVFRFFPEWDQGRKKLVTIRMLLNETSGLPEPGDARNSLPPDVVRFALASELASNPGEKFSPSSDAVDLLLGIIAQASGKAADEYIAERLFAPLGISDVAWQKDSAGNCLGSGLLMAAQDAAKLGQLVLDNGMWGRDQLIPEAFINEMINPTVSKNVEYGLLWTRTPAWIRLSVDDSSFDLLHNLNVPDRVLAKLSKLRGHTFNSSESLVSALHSTLGDSEFDVLYNAAQARSIRMGSIFHLELGPMAAFSASGDGQYIVVVPAAKVVAVRQSLMPDDQYDDFVERVLDVAKSWASSLKP
jgi:CubicO group peptidase (beta-lactamase class C family)